MDKQQKIQAAIDALPHATGGEWGKRLCGDPLQPQDTWCIDWSDDQEEVAEHVYGEANATLIAAAKDLAEEVVRLRMLLERIRQHSNMTSEDARWMQMAAAHGIDPKWPAPKGCVILSSTLGDQIVEEASKQSGIPVEALLAPIPGMYAINKMPEGKLVVGGLELCKQAEGSIWIQDTTSQEGFETPITDLEGVLRNFWMENF